MTVTPASDDEGQGFIAIADPLANARRRLNRRIRWSAMLHNVRDVTGEHEKALTDAFFPDLPTDGQPYNLVQSCFEDDYKYCKRQLKNGLRVSFFSPFYLNPFIYKNKN